MLPPSSDPSALQRRETVDDSVDGETWQELLASFRERPEDIPAAAKRAAVDYRTAEKALRYGFGQGWPAISHVLDEEALAVRARLDAEEREAQRLARLETQRKDTERNEAARRQAIKARAEEGQIITFARADTLLALNAATKVLSALSTVGEDVAKAITTPGGITPDDYVRYLRVSSAAMRASVEAGQMVMQMERLFLGTPTHIIALAGAGAPRSREEALAELDESIESLQKAREAPSHSPIAATALPEPVR